MLMGVDLRERDSERKQIGWFSQKPNTLSGNLYFLNFYLTISFSLIDLVSI